MDMEAEFEDFQKKNQPSLIGSSVRNSNSPSGLQDKEESEETIKERARSSSRPVVKSSSSVANLDTVSVDELKAEGGLLNDEEGEVLETILDEEGHLKRDALQIQELQKSENGSETPASGSSGAIEPETSHKHHEIYGGDGGQFVAPAAAVDGEESNFKYESAHGGTPQVVEKEPELFKAQEPTTVDDILERINQGQRETEAGAPPQVSQVPQVSQAPQAPQVTRALEVDLQNTAPASVREGSSSRLFKESERSRSRHSLQSPQREGTGLNKPHLARGESYHSGVSNDEHSGTPPLGSSDSSEAAERRPRHEPGSVRISNSSSLRYLRSISRSRSRVANDKDAIGKDRGADEDELRSEGALLHDGDFSQMAELEDAITNALSLVENTRSVKDGSKFASKGNIVSHLHESVSSPDLDQVKEEEEDEGKGVETKEVKGGEKEVKWGEKAVEKEEPVEKEETAVKEVEPVEEVEENSEDPVGEEPIKEKSVEEDSAKKPVESEDPIEEKVVEEPTKEKAVEEPVEKELTKDTVQESSVQNEPVKEELIEKEITKESSEIVTPEEIIKESPEEITKETPEEIKESYKEPVQSPVQSPVQPVDSTTSPAVLEDDIDKLIEEAQKEQAANHANSSSTAPAGSVYVPKQSKMTFEDEPVYIYTSLAGGFQIMTRTNRLQTILTANKVQFEFKDLGTDETAKKVWKRYSGGKTLPGVVRGVDDFIGNWEDIEEANENYEVRSLIYETY